MTKAQLEKYAEDQIAANHVLQQQLDEARNVARDARGALVEFEEDERVNYWFAINDTMYPWLTEEMR